MSLKRRLYFILFLVIFFASAFLTLGHFSLRRSVPSTTGHFYAAGLQQPVEIGWDEWGIPHISARSEADLYFMQGYVAAQDRLWQMDLMRRAAQGRLCEVFGERFLDADVFARTIGFENLAGNLLAILPPENFTQLQSYCAGINAYIRSARQLPIEFTVLRYQPDPWKPDDCLASQRLIGWLLSMGWHVDLVYGDLLSKVDSAKFAQIMPQAYPGQRMAPAPPAPVSNASRGLLRGESDLRALLNSPVTGLGSNAWAVSGRHTQRGQAILANDTHLPFTAPSIYYLCHLRSPKINAVGASIPGLPGLVVGRNESIAWGVTHGMIDDVDFMALQPDSIDTDHYLYNGQRFALTRQDVTIQIKDKAPHKFRVTRTLAGPVVNSQTPILGIRDSEPLVLRWTGFNPDDPLTSWQKLLQSRDWSDFRRALENCKNPGENFIYADARGNIGMQLAAEIPLRNFQNAWHPVSDTLYRADWLGAVPYELLPKIYQPLNDRIVNANQCLVDSSYAFYLSAYWEPDYRYRRIHHLLDTLRVADVASFRALQNDVYSEHAARFVPQLLKVLAPLSLPQNSPADFGRELLSVWDFHQSSSSVAATVYEATCLELMRRTFSDEMGDELYGRFLEMPHFNISTLDRLIAANDSAWFDDERTRQVETLQTQMQASFYTAIEELTIQYGNNPGLWTWGDVHTLTQPHPFGTHAPFRRYFNIGPYPTAGGNFTINNSTYLLSKPYAAFIGPCVRQIADMSTPEYHVIIPAGQSSHPFSPHYKDMTPLWRQGALITLNLNSLESRNRGWQWQTIHPAGK